MRDNWPLSSHGLVCAASGLSCECLYLAEASLCLSSLYTPSARHPSTFCRSLKELPGGGPGVLCGEFTMNQAEGVLSLCLSCLPLLLVFDSLSLLSEASPNL